MKIIDDLLKFNPYSRPGKNIVPKYLVIHYTGGAGVPGTRTRDYFNNLPEINKDKVNPTYVSSHYVVDLDGTIIRCIPEDEIAYTQSGNNNEHNSVECAHPTEDGKFTTATYNAVIELAADWFMRHPNNNVDKHLKRHYDFTGKYCPLYYVKNPKAWETLKQDVKDKLSGLNKITDLINENMDRSVEQIPYPHLADDPEPRHPKENPFRKSSTSRLSGREQIK